MDLARLQIFDILFSGHDHNESNVTDDAPPGFKVGRTLVHQGVSAGRAVVWAEVCMQLRKKFGGDGSAPESECGRVVDATAGADPIDDRYEDDSATVQWLDGCVCICDLRVRHLLSLSRPSVLVGTVLTMAVCMGVLRYRVKPILPECPDGFVKKLNQKLGCACPTGYHIERRVASLLPTYPCKIAELLRRGCVRSLVNSVRHSLHVTNLVVLQNWTDAMQSGKLS